MVLIEVLVINVNRGSSNCRIEQILKERMTGLSGVLSILIRCIVSDLIISLLFVDLESIILN